MKSLSRFVAALGVLCLAVPPMFAEERPSLIQFVRPLGMGGAFTALADDQNIFAFNPAGMVQRTGAQVTLLELAVGGSEDLKDAYDFIKNNEDKLTDFENLPPSEQAALTNEINNTISKLDPRLYVAADLASYVSGPHFMGLPMHVGFGAFGVGDANFRLDADVLVPSISYEINNDIIIPLSIAHRWNAPGFIPGRIGVGFTGKIMRRNQISQQNISVLTLDSLDAPPLATGAGVGSDLGFLYQPTDRTNVGLMVQDFLGTKLHFDALAAEDGFQAQPSRDSVIRPRTNIGWAVVPNKLLWLLPTNDRWTFAIDVRDVTGSEGEHLMFEEGFKKPIGEDLPTHLHMGAEYRYWFLRFRGGAYQGYPSFGLGVDIPFLKIDYAYYSRELGAEAGTHREKNHVVSLALRFGSGATESRERINKSKETKKMKDSSVPESSMETPSGSAAPASDPNATPGDAGDQNIPGASEGQKN